MARSWHQRVQKVYFEIVASLVEKFKILKGKILRACSCLPLLPALGVRGHDDCCGGGTGCGHDCHGKEGLAAEVAAGSDVGGRRHKDLERHQKNGIQIQRVHHVVDFYHVAIRLRVLQQWAMKLNIE